MHLLYTRFFTKAMRDMGLVDFDEPFTAAVQPGHHPGAGRPEMSKSRGNVVNPDDYVDALRRRHVPLLPDVHRPVGPGRPVEPAGIEGVHRFLNRVWAWRMASGGHPRPVPGMPPAQSLSGEPPGTGGAAPDTVAAIVDAIRDLRRVAHRSIREVSEDYLGFHFNTVISG